jgi:peptidyl-prolyl cis-trans isomerase C
MPQAYANALRDKPAGSTVGPFQTEGGWAVLRVEDRRRETPPTLEQARPQIVRYLTYEGVRQLLEELRGKAEVDVLLNGDAARPQEPASAPAAPAAGSPASAPAPASAS